MTKQTRAHTDTLPHNNGYVSDWALEVPPTSNQPVGTPDDRGHLDRLERVRGRLIDADTDPDYAHGVADALAVLRQLAADS